MSDKSNYISNLVNTLRNQGAVILLESQMSHHPAGAKSYLAGRPESWIKAEGAEIEVFENGQSRVFQQNPWEALKEFKERQSDWLFGFLGYDLKNYTEELQSQNKRLVNAPDLYFMVPGTLAEIDDIHTITTLKGELPEVNVDYVPKSPVSVQLKNRISEAKYLTLVEQAKRDIFEGAYYEINLSHPLEFKIDGDSLELYKSMKAAGPVPFGGYLEIDNLAVCCSSPERFLARKGEKVWSQPIKGTAPHKQYFDVQQEIEKLKKSEKDRAENLMIVDLVRNDLSRVAAKNSVKVSSLFEIQSFETVHQMVSTVECRVEENTESIDVIQACFPMGSMTGAPKIAVMKAIDEYENYKRGIYSGALGYIKPDGDFDFNVIIRTAVIEGEKLIYPVGGAVTSDSDPKEEWRETLTKAKAITNVSEKVKNAE